MRKRILSIIALAGITISPFALTGCAGTQGNTHDMGPRSQPMNDAAMPEHN
jgi:hypothetical protein